MKKSDNKMFTTNKVDIITSVAKSAVGIIPFAGPLLSELVGDIIPNQRFDRLSSYVKLLDEKLSDIPIDKIKALFDNSSFIDLIEEGFVQASRSITEKRRDYISSIIKNGIDQAKIDFHESKSLLKILQELNDIEIIWLRYYLIQTAGGDQEYRNKHKVILSKIYLTTESDEETRRKAALQDSYKEHLERLNLIESHFTTDRKTKLPKTNLFGNIEKSYPSITFLGKLLLKQMGIINEL
jgi:hypothetical protein